MPLSTDVRKLVLGAAVALFAAGAQAEGLKPFVLGAAASGEPAATVAQVREALGSHGFEVVGDYSPYPHATILVVTNDALKQAATKSDFGGYGAAQRVSVTQLNDQVQVAYTNPVYMAHAYRMDADLSPVAAQLEQALGRQGEYGPAEGLTPRKLARYRYMFGMERFDNQMVLAKHGSFDEAVAKVEANLAAGEGGASKVYRIDIPGKQQAVFGVALTEGASNDAEIMQEIDFKDTRSTPHLPYELMVSGDTVYAMHARFRIAMNFPDLSMMGANSFMGIMSAPGAIERALTLVAGGDLHKGDNSY